MEAQQFLFLMAPALLTGKTLSLSLSSTWIDIFKTRRGLIMPIAIERLSLGFQAILRHKTT